LVDTDNCIECTHATCGDGILRIGWEECDDANEDNTDDCAECEIAECGDSFVQVGVEECDDGNNWWSVVCTPQCLLNVCGDGYQGHPDDEQCDDGDQDDTDDCTNACTIAECGDGIVHAGVEDCDDGNPSDQDSCLHDCTPGSGLACSNGWWPGSSLSPGNDMMVCTHEGWSYNWDLHDTICAYDGDSVCPAGWGLCSYEQYVNRNDDWNASAVSENGFYTTAEVYCRDDGTAGGLRFGGDGYDWDDLVNLDFDYPLNCDLTTSRADSCAEGNACGSVANVLCCAPTLSCGNGVVDSIEEACDDGNQDETDDCLNSCSLREPGC
jgi:cysteine-rich repeat protein